MIDTYVDIAVIGAGPAGLAAAISAKKHGANNVLIVERNNWLGGILPQCIHDGFGVEELKVSLTGPEYAQIYIKQIEESNIEIMKETMVLTVDKEKKIYAINKQGLFQIHAKVVIFAMGCREKTRWYSMIAGSRPSGIYTAGVAQAFINLYNIIPGKDVVILGSGDVGLIIARRLKFEGANVHGVVELLPHASGLPRNVVQCLDDYDIPIFLNHTVINIEGNERVESVTIVQVDDKRNPIAGTEKKIYCDTLLLSLGLIPENELSKEIGVAIDEVTGGPLVNQYFETSCSGFFACGNCLQVYDTVDMLSSDAKIAGKYAAKKISSKKDKTVSKSKINAGKGVRYVIPHYVECSEPTELSFRVVKPQRNVKVCIQSQNKELAQKNFAFVHPSNMSRLIVMIPEDVINLNQDIEVSIIEK